MEEEEEEEDDDDDDDDDVTKKVLFHRCKQMTVSHGLISLIQSH
jgi:hypothetical protein